MIYDEDFIEYLKDALTHIKDDYARAIIEYEIHFKKPFSADIEEPLTASDIRNCIKNGTEHIPTEKGEGIRNGNDE